MKIAVITDSSFGNFDNKNPDLYFVPLIFTASQAIQYFDDDNLTLEVFLSLMNENSNLKTSQTPIGIMLELWDQLLTRYDQIIFCGIAKSLSGQYNTYKILSNNQKYKNRVFIINSNGVSIILEHQINWIFQLIKNNKDGKTIIKMIEDGNNQYETYIIPKNWGRLKQSGRVSKFNVWLAQTLKIILILKNKNGKIIVDSKQRTFTKAIKYALENIKNKIPNLKIIDVAYGITNQKTLELIKRIIANYNLEIGLWSPISKTIMIHTGIETFAFCGWHT